MNSTQFNSKVLDAIMNAAIDAIVISDSKGNILQANTAAHRLFDFEQDELKGLNVAEIMPESQARHHDGHMSNYLKTGQKKIIGIGRNTQGQRKNGEVFPIHLSVGETTVDGENIFVAILYDNTRNHANQAALARTMRLDAIGRMTGGIAHDFNNFLTVIIGNLELAAMRSTDENVNRYIANAVEAAETGSDLTSRLMIFARRGSLQPEVTDMGKICNRMLRLIRRTIGERYTVISDCPESLSPVEIDPVQLESALLNLALNARDAMPDGGKLRFQVSEIEIDDTYMAQETDVRPGNYVRILVSDTGQGMTPEVQKLVFEPFFTTKSEREGTGLGLSMVHGFVRQSGGHITLYSEPGHGTSFGLYFPALASGTLASDASPAVADLDLGKGECILVVEDNDKLRAITEERLKALNYTTRTATNAKEAIDILQSDAKIDLVFSDIVMPGELTGFDLAKWIDESMTGIKVLLTSGYASDVVTGQMDVSLTHQILHKPYHQRELATLLSTLLGTASG